MRPHQWVKNTFVLAPLVFSQSLSEGGLLLRAAMATAIFCLVSGSVYIINDLLDREGDRAHPVKCRRPIASGMISPAAARTVAAVVLVTAGIGATLLEPWFALVLATYFTLNLAYSVHLKHVVFVDVSIIAMGFLLRVLGGALAISVPISVWLVVCTFLLSLYLGLGKRAHELVAVEKRKKTRKVLDQYQIRHVRWAMMISALLTSICYAAYTLDPSTVAQFGTGKLIWTVPFIGFGVLRFYKLTLRVDHPESPTEQMIRDPLFLVNLALWGVLILVILYT